MSQDVNHSLPVLPAPAGSKADADDFTMWMEEWCQRGSPHQILTGFRVLLRPLTYQLTLTAEQALRLAERLRQLAEEE